ncbi:MAG TPA: alpha/beta hydrolase [Gemmatimonadaceae bacterium]
MMNKILLIVAGLTIVSLSACSHSAMMQTATGEVGPMMGKPQVDMVSLGVVPVQMGSMDAPMPTAQPTPAMKMVLDELASFKAPPIDKSTPAQAREAPTPRDAVMGVMAKRNQAPAIEMVGDVSHKVIPGPGGDLLVRVYTPRGSGPFPVLVYYHGGGWVIANLDGYDAGPRALTNAANAVVVSLAYRQAPTHKFPAAADDAFAAYQWVLNNAASINGDPNRVAVGGESAGGNLAAVVSMMARDRGVKLPVHQLLVYPITSFNFDSPSYRENANAAPLSKAAMQWFFDKYMRSAADAQNPYLIPLNGNLKGLPSATIINAELDPLRWDGEEYARRLNAAGVSATQKTYAGVTHEFFGMGAVVPEAKDAVQMAAMALKTAYGTR